MSRPLVALLVAMAVFVAAGCGSSRMTAANTTATTGSTVPTTTTPSGASTASTCAREADSTVATSASYRFVLHAGMPERMYTPAEATKLHPMSGEVMVGGSMAAGGMSMGGNSHVRHLETQICSRTTGAVVVGAMPTMLLSDSMGMKTHVPVAMMRGVDAGMDDVHYGNNVTMPAGKRLTLRVTLRGETAMFHVAG